MSEELKEKVRDLQEETRISKEHRERLEKSLSSVHRRITETTVKVEKGFGTLEKKIDLYAEPCMTHRERTAKLETSITWLWRTITAVSVTASTVAGYFGWHKR